MSLARREEIRDKHMKRAYKLAACTQGYKKISYEMHLIQFIWPLINVDFEHLDVQQ